MFIKRSAKLRISTVSLWLLIFNVYVILSGYILTNELLPNELLNFTLPPLVLIFFDNVDFNVSDLKTFNTVLAIVAIGTFIASFVQLTIDHHFYSGINEQAEILASIDFYKVGPGIYRNHSLYRGVGPNEGAHCHGKSLFIEPFHEFLQD